ncbi:glycerol-3-phosphate dehydrogenase/oxidase [Lederbergia wuyishanensis]|uniref:Glycerol-3-phosphate dehydrogenase n=1 Tax=Lederbergia wuyishanensis TaxID=1347903 RepID=A0ABU0CZZ2_9BACI|nr:FAD-dependent oxidoreductase [Lederbergia wuyishanensis]MCJ8006355.1 glycerol-3-phosphate dehydrogenase/oxidase [Lederbergia wuyishanensis]MDQ0341724.1 glycerol-3-phosphate dehydrogenase [Lederbergia wuyishanensis]
MNKLSGLNRQTQFDLLSNTQYEVLIIGGGITGAGIALDAVTRGMKTALVEMQDFAAGTSSRSTKLVHGGLRYLKQLEIKEVSDLGKERAIVYENGPHVTTPEWMLLPFYEKGTFGKFTTSIGLKVYDFLANVKKDERRKILSKEETLIKEPLIKKDGLLGGGYYVEYRTDDARLTIEVMKSAGEHGANLMNYAKVEKLLYDEKGKVNGAMVKDLITGKEYTIHADIIINATGPWVDYLRSLDQSKEGKHLQLSKGVHIVFDQSKFPLKQSVYFDAPDGRMIFAIPRDGKTYVGTTDTFYKGDIQNPTPQLEDIGYLLECIQYIFPTLQILRTDIESSWAGLRPLIYEEGKNPSEISRKDEIWVSESGLITIAGGKLTGYRKMAETTVNFIANKLSKINLKDYGPTKTKTLPISGGKIGSSKNINIFINNQIERAKNFNLTSGESSQLAAFYGSNIDFVYSFIEEGKSLPPIIYARLMYAIHHEMAIKPVDFFIRRTGWLYFNIDEVNKWKQPVLNIMSEVYQWDDNQYEEYKEELEQAIMTANFQV